MIQFNCPGCGQKYTVPDEKAGVKAKCKKCGAAMQVPQLRAADADAYDVVETPAPAAPVKPARTPQPAHAPAAARPPQQKPGAAPAAQASRLLSSTPRPKPADSDDPSDRAKEPQLGRPYDPATEALVRKRFAIVLGCLLILAWIAPTLIGLLGGRIIFPQISGLFEGRVPLVIRIQSLIPLLGGIAILVTTLAAPFPARAIAMLTSVTISFILGFLALGELNTGGALSSFMRTPEGAVGIIIMIMTFVGVFGTLIGTRLRFYRPDNTLGYLLPTIGGACILVLLLWPMGDYPLLVMPFQALGRMPMFALSMLVLLLGILASGVISVFNPLSKEPRAASRQARLAFWVFILSIAVFATYNLLHPIMSFFEFSLSGMWDFARAIIMILITAAAGIGGFALFPMGVTDLLVGRTREPHECIQCGYDLRGGTGDQCPECGLVTA